MYNLQEFLNQVIKYSNRAQVNIKGVIKEITIISQINNVLLVEDEEQNEYFILQNQLL